MELNLEDNLNDTVLAQESEALVPVTNKQTLDTQKRFAGRLSIISARYLLFSFVFKKN